MSSEAQERNSGPIRIDVGETIRGRLPRLWRWIPKALVRRLERLVHQDDMNEMLEVCHPRRGSEFCSAVINHLDIDIRVKGMENMPARDDRRVIFVSNHPLGGLDGMSLISFIADYYEVEPLFVINDLLMAVEPLREVFVPVNKHGSQSRRTIGLIDDAMKGDRPVIIFPAGLCSRRRGGEVRDLEWQKMFVQKARQWGRDIVPLRFVGENSENFYKWANRREKSGLKFNAEMILLPGEVFKSRGKVFEIIVGKRIGHETLSGDLRGETEKIRKIVDNLCI